MGKTFTSVHTRGFNQNAETPDKVINIIAHLLGTRDWFDPCPASPTEDGLLSQWNTINYVNPPFRDAKEWILKAISEQNARNSRSLFLIPARTCTAYFYDLIFKHAHTIIFMLNRIRFKGYKRLFGVPLMLFLISNSDAEADALFLKETWNVFHIPCSVLWCGFGKINTEVLPRMREFYLGNRDTAFDTEVIMSDDPSKLRLCGSTHLIIVMSKPIEHMEKINTYYTKHRNRNRKQPTMTVVVFATRFNDSFFRKHVINNAKHVLFIRPLIKFNAFRSFIGSCAVTFTSSASSASSAWHYQTQHSRKCLFIDFPELHADVRYLRE